MQAVRKIDREEVRSLFEALGTVRGVARQMGIEPKSVRFHLKKLGIQRPMVAPICDTPDLQVVKRTSTLLDPDGNIKQQWVIAETDKEQMLQAFQKSLEALLAPIRGLATRTAAPRKCDPSKMALYIDGDPHFGQHAWHQETGSDWDLSIAERVTVGATRLLMDRAPCTEDAVIVSVGDTSHADSARAMTPQSGNLLDVDSRFNRVFWTILRSYKTMVEVALTKHKRVKVLIVPGNHDPTVSHMIAIALHQYYSNERRVDVDVSPTARRYFRFGNNLVGVTHGDKQKRARLPGMMATERREDWGATEFKFWFLGHIHHLVREDLDRVHMEHMRTMASEDAWHAEAGYLSLKDKRVIVLHKSFGECERYTVSRLEVDA